MFSWYSEDKSWRCFTLIISNIFSFHLLLLLRNARLYDLLHKQGWIIYHLQEDLIEACQILTCQVTIKHLLFINTQTIYCLIQVNFKSCDLHMKVNCIINSKELSTIETFYSGSCVNILLTLDTSFRDYFIWTGHQLQGGVFDKHVIALASFASSFSIILLKVTLPSFNKCWKGWLTGCPLQGENRVKSTYRTDV